MASRHKTPLERRYAKRRRRGKMLSPVRTKPTPEHPLGVAFPATTRYGVPGNLWATGHHTGTDFQCPVGSIVVATQAGTVVWIGERGGWSAPPTKGRPWAYGNHVIVRTWNGRWDYAVCHLSAIRVMVGQKVIPGTILGLSGATGNVTGPHVHMETRPAGGRYGSDVSPVHVRRRPRKVR